MPAPYDATVVRPRPTHPAAGPEFAHFRPAPPPPPGPPPVAPARSALGLAIGIGAAVLVLGVAITGMVALFGVRAILALPAPVTTVRVTQASAPTTRTSASPVRTTAGSTATSVSGKTTAASTTVKTSAITTPAPSGMTEAQARALLDSEAKSYAVATDNHYLVELSAKWVGAVDPQLTAANGGHTFYAVDILAEYRDLRAKFGSSVRMVYSTSFGKQTVNSKIPPGELLYVVVYDPRTFSGKDAAQAWCRSAFPGLSGDPLDNVCLPRPASPPF